MIDISKIYQLRPYHNLQHLWQVKESLSEFIQIPDRLQIAIDFHDIVYEAGSPYNEQFSAALVALEYPDMSEYLDFAISATKHHAATGEREVDLFLDADMSILAAQTDDYAKYLKGIREEYKRFSDEQWCDGRKKFLTTFNGFLTPEFSKYNQAAMDNIEAELLCL